ncbi:hypothetical protein [Flavobacterium poyangense]|uniref:hypothetical protein n=1 Tax=Flavobacterium poyangense TaxID=2204302 RepID=UPI0014203D79|nr:hypothetical protein [Flavobacterium sp. JXAS1]
MKNVVKQFLKGTVILAVAIFLGDCSKEDSPDEPVSKASDPGVYNLKTVTLEKSLDFFKELNRKQLTSRRVDVADIGLEIDLSTLEQIDITDTDAKLNIASAKTNLEGVETEILQIEIDGAVQTVLFHRVPEKRTNKHISRAPADPAFTGSVYSTDIKGQVLSGFKIDKGNVAGSYNTLLSAIDPVPLKEVIIKNNYITPPTNDARTRLNYQFVRSRNNGSSMGIAYASYFRKLNNKKFDDGIMDARLDECLKKVLNDLKKTIASPGNMVTNFTGDWNATRYNWTVISDTKVGDKPFTGETSRLYNEVTGVTTTFYNRAWPDATDLSWARTILHESIHAYFVVYFRVDGVGANTAYPHLVEEWNAKKNIEVAHHEEMAISLVAQVRDALEIYGVSKGYRLDRQFYQDMAWGGLTETKAFKALPFREKARIKDVLSVELTGKDVDGDVQFQRGKRSKC